MGERTSSWRLSDPDRPIGILNSRLRKYLQSRGPDFEATTEYERELKQKLAEIDIEPKSPAERQARQEIRDRVINAIFDFNLLAGNLEERDKRRILNDGWDPERHSERNEDPLLHKVRDDLPVLITFIYQLYQIDSQSVASEALSKTVKRGIESAHAAAGQHATADVNIEVTVSSGIENIHNQLKEEGPESITEEQAHLLYSHDRLSLEEYTNVLKAINQ